MAPGPTEPKADASPESGTVPPSRIVFAVTPGSAVDARSGRRDERERDQQGRALHPETGFASVESLSVTAPIVAEPEPGKPR